MIDEWSRGKLTKTSEPHALDYKIYCDESCHLEHDGSDVMVFGALRCKAESVEEIIRSIKSLREKYGYHTEIKWTKLLRKQIPFYRELIDLFLQSDALSFKATSVINKGLLDHTQYNQGSHGVFYYKVAFYTLRDFLRNKIAARVHFDYMDTQGKTRAKKLLEILTNECPAALLSSQIVRSEESQLIQFCDLLIGAISYARRFAPDERSEVKGAIVDYLENSICRNLVDGTPPWEEKFNIFVFSPRGGRK
ncbi:DUF3800 domain-containing protein [Burkholderia vietnamiensis]|uniref:DUF3800 domain-containing protein n=1 Tax=Burkholderia cepacia complex TaxID=87882 RepID=UPI0014544198|nr:MULTISPECIES: DUF3800 domain-containing protein [Burkholderia cepacia complex]MBR7919016.1 DUF3800 domain-containing protein [Burkholderia vietnamiensis]VWD12359.1 hypothetical protein BCO18442_03306 [Burkholderia contaminans]HDR9061243.1 DUF3800 domain-containing protein [Burkholderia vietnamiensis]